jgi:hypothetical protein
MEVAGVMLSGENPTLPRLKGSVQAPITWAMSEVVSIHSARSARTVEHRSTVPSSTAVGRRGDQAGRIVQRGGRTFRVYGSGEDHNVFELPIRKKPSSTWGGVPAA